MALPASGIITSAMILTELGITGSGNVLYNIIQKPAGILQVKVNNDWVNLNMCSPYLPSEVPAYIVATDWYGYDHGTSGVETLTITGDTTIDVGQTVTYTATMTGDNLAGVVLTWYRFEIDSWSPALGTGSTVSITWTDPRNAKVRVVASNICNLNIVQRDLDITYNCTTITGDPYVGGTYAVNQPFDVWAVNSLGVVGTPSNTRLGITFFWEVTGSVQIVSGQGTNKVVLKPTSVSSNLNVRVTIGSCGGISTSSYVTFSSSTPVTYTYNDAQSRSIQKNNCGNGQIGSYHTVTREANTHVSTNPDPVAAKAEANAAAVAWLYTQDAQNIANADPYGSCGSTPPVSNDYRSGTYTKYCSSGTGTQVTLVVPAGTYYAADKAAANTLAENYIAANGQSNADAQGQCIAAGCSTTVTNVTASYTPNTGYIDVAVQALIGASGIYTVTVSFNGATVTYNEYIGTTGTLTGAGYCRVNVTGTGTLNVTVASSCSSYSWSSSTFTVSGSTACTDGLIEHAATRGYFGGGVYTVAMGFNNYANLRNIAGRFELHSGGSLLQTDYFSGLDFSGGNTVYQSFSVPPGTNWTVYIACYITSGDNLCTSNSYTNYNPVTIVNPV